MTVVIACKHCGDEASLSNVAAAIAWDQHHRTVCTTPAPAKASLPPSPYVTDTTGTYGAVTGGNGRSQPTPCPTCGLPVWDGLHANGHRTCFMSEVPGV